MWHQPGPTHLDGQLAIDQQQTPESVRTPPRISSF
jgi:hypothetical protein